MSDTNHKTIFRLGAGSAGLVVLLVIIAAITFLVSSFRLRTDLTSGKLYTLSSGSKQILSKLDHDVVLKFFFSSSSAEMPMGLKTYAKQVQDILREYQRASGGHLTLEAYDPQPDSDAEEWAQRYGIEPQQTSMFGQPVYFGLVAVCGDAEEALPGLSPRTEATLEYDITRLLTRVAWPEKPVVGVMSTLEVLGTPSNPMMMMQRQQPNRGWLAFQDLRKDYQVREIETSAEKIDADVKTLVVVHPKALSDKTLFAIDQFVLRGGRLLVFVDPLSVVDLEANQQQAMMGQQDNGLPGSSTLGRLFDTWGIGFDTTKVVADVSCATKLNGGDNRVEENTEFLSLGRDNLTKEDILTAQLSSVMLPFSGAIVDKQTGGVHFTPLLMTSKDKACLVDAMTMGMGTARSAVKPDGQQRVLAARLQGTFTTAFPDGVEGGETNAVTDRLRSGTSTVMVFGDVDFLQDNFCVQRMNSFFGSVAQPINDNLTLFGNAVEQFAGREELIGVRSRRPFDRPFVKVDKLEADAMLKWQAEEERLESALQETQTRLDELQKQKTGNERLILSKEQQEELAQFRQKQAETRKQLKEVRKNLNQEIERLGLNLKLVNILAVPVVVVGLGLYRGIRRKRR